MTFHETSTACASTIVVPKTIADSENVSGRESFMNKDFDILRRRFSAWLENGRTSIDERCIHSKGGFCI